VLQADHQPNWQVRAASGADAVAEFELVCAQQIGRRNPVARARFTSKVKAQGLLNCSPRQPFAQYHQRALVIDHASQTGAKEIGCIGHKNPPETVLSNNDS
jgi:hypothetical protein